MALELGQDAVFSLIFNDNLEIVRSSFFRVHELVQHIIYMTYREKPVPNSKYCLNLLGFFLKEL